MSNDNYVQAVSGFHQEDEGELENSYYVAADSSAMSARAADGSFAAFCTFYLRGEVVNASDGSPLGGVGFLWGTLSGAAGWALHLTTDADNILSLTAEVGTGELISVPLTAVTLGGGNRSSFVERLIMAGLWFDGDSLNLSVNGNIVGPPIAVAAYAPGATPARMGLQPGNTSPLTYGDVVSCGYFSGFPLSASARLISQLAGQAFRSAREGFGSGLLLPDNGKDWTHRYWARSLASGNAPASGNISKNPIGVSITAPALAIAAIADIGQSGPLDTPAGLSQLNHAGDDLFLASQKNIDWYQGMGVQIAAPEGG